jgi:outer membrane protein assembly factor BamB
MRRRAWWRSAVAVVAVLGLSGCFWGQSGFDAGGSGYNRYESRVTAANVSSLVELWQADLDHAGVESVVQSGGGLLHAADNQAVYGIDAATGERRWRTPLAGLDTGAAFPAADSDDVVVGAYGAPSGPGSLAQMDAATGALVGATPIDARTIEGSGGALQTVRTGDWAVTVFAGQWSVGTSGLPWWEADFTVTNLADPSRSWSYTNPLDNTKETQSISNPVIVGDRVYAVVRLIRLVSRDPFVLEVARRYVGGWDLAEPCTSPCDPDWVVDLPLEPSGSGLAASHDGTTLFTSAANKLHAVDIASGTVAWTAGAPVSVSSAAPTSTPDGVFLTTGVSSGAGGKLIAYPPGGCGAPTCAPVWTTTLPGNAIGGMAATEDLLFLATRDNTLAAYPTECTDGCAPLWSTDLGTRWLASPPIISRGRVVVAADGNNTASADALIAFGLPPSG